MPETPDGGWLLDDSDVARDSFIYGPNGRQPDQKPKGMKQEGEAMAEDAHVHELPDGTRTGPPIYEEPAMEEGAEEGMVEPVEAPPALAAPPQTLRAKSVRPVLTKAEELAQVRMALTSANPQQLPPRGLEIWTRMHDSAKRFSAGRHPEQYPVALAWYAIRKKYGLNEKGGPGHAVHSPVTGTKTVNSYPTVQERGGWLVRMGSATPRATAAWDRVETIPVPWAPGASLTVGYSNGNQATITGVFVPGSITSSKTEEHGKAAMQWVREHWHMLWRLGKSRSLPYPPGTKSFRHFSKFVLTPDRATRRIAYGIAYMPWEVDLQGQFATEDEVEAMAHKFMLNQGRAGEMHSRWDIGNGEPPYRLVESFLAREDDPHFPEGAWVVGTQFAPPVWSKVVSGQYRGFSIGGNWGRRVLRLANADAVWAGMALEDAA